MLLKVSGYLSCLCKPQLCCSNLTFHYAAICPNKSSCQPQIVLWMVLKAVRGWGHGNVRVHLVFVLVAEDAATAIGG
jgi:hypothetical protein